MHPRWLSRIALTVALLSVAAGYARAQEMIAVSARKLVVIDKPSSGGDKLLFIAKDAATTKGTAEDPSAISALFSAGYDGNLGSFFVYPGIFDGTAGWTDNDAERARFRNKQAPGAAGSVKSLIVEEGRRALLKAASTGDLALDLVGIGTPTGPVATLYCLSNGPEQFCMCTKFTDCSYHLRAGGNAAKLVCRDGDPDPTCNSGS